MNEAEKNERVAVADLMLDYARLVRMEAGLKALLIATRDSTIYFAGHGDVTLPYAFKTVGIVLK